MASNEDILLQFTAQDSISSILTSIDSTLQEIFNSVTEGVANLNNSIDQLNSAAENMNNILAGNTAEDLAEGLNDAAQAAEEASDSLSDVAESAQEASDAIDDISTDVEVEVGVDDSQIQDAAESKDELNDDTQFTAEVDSGEIDDALEKKDGLNEDTNTTVNVDSSGIDDLTGAAAGIATAMGATEMMDTAGRISDSWNRLELTFGSVSEGLKSDISEAADATGRSGGVVRGYFNQMGIAGVTNTQLLEDSFKSVAGFAYQSGQDIGAMSTKLQTMVLTGNAGTKMLKSLGLSADDLGAAMGVAGDEAADAFKELSNEERLQVVTKALGDGTKANEMYKESWEGVKEKASAELAGLMGAVGTPILEFMIPLMHQLTDIVESITTTFKGLPAPVKTAVGGLLAGTAGLTAFAGLIGPFTKAIGGLKTGFTTLGNIASGVPAIGDKFTKFGKTITGVVKGAEGAGAAAAEGAVAGAEMEAGAVSLSSIASGAMAMLAPLLEIAIVVAVMIPVIAALAAEALLFVKGLQILIDALDFDSINLDGAINGITQVAQALFMVGVAMGAMTFTNVMTSVALVTSALTGLINPIAVARGLLMQAAEELQGFAGVNIDSSIPDNIKKIADSLKTTSEAMNSLTGVIGATAWAGFISWVGGLGSVTNAISQARSDIEEAGKQLNLMKDLPTIDSGVTDKLKAVGDGLKGVSDAMSALGSLSWDASISNFVSIVAPITNLFSVDSITALTNAKEDITRGATALSQFTGLPEIPQGVSDKLKKIGDGLSGVSDAFNALRKIRDDSNWDNFWNGGGLFPNGIQSSLTSIKNDIFSAATILRSYTTLPEIPGEVAGKVRNVADGTKSVIGSLNSIIGANIPDLVTLALLPVRISASRLVLQNIANQLNQLNTLPTIQEDLTSKITSVGSKTTVLGSVLNQMKNAQIPDVLSLAILPVRIALAKTVLQNTANQLNTLNGIPPVGEGLAVKLNNLAIGARAVGSAVSSINSIPYIGPEAGLKVQLAVNAVRKAMTELNRLSGGAVNVAGVVASVRSALIQVRGALNAMSGGFRASSVNLGRSITSGVRSGMAGLASTVRSVTSSAMASARGTASSGARAMGSGATTGFKSTFHLAQIARNEMNYAVQAINNGSGALARAARKAAEDAVAAAKAGADAHSPGAIARMWGQEIGEYSVQNMLSGGARLARTSGDVSRNVVNAWNSRDLATNMSLPSNLSRTINMNSLNGAMQSPAPQGNNGSNIVIYNFSQGAIPVDARNMTKTEAKQLMILALEGLDSSRNNNIRGIGA